MSASSSKDESEMTEEEWNAAYDRISDDLDGYHDRVLAKHDSGQPMTEAEETVFQCLGFWLVANVNSGDIFGYLNIVIDHEKRFEAIGAKGTLEAKEKLLPLYREMMAKPTQKEQMDFWHATREQREKDEGLAEGTVGFGQLLHGLRTPARFRNPPGWKGLAEAVGGTVTRRIIRRASRDNSATPLS